MNHLTQLTGLWQLDDPKDFINFQSKVGPGYFFASTTTTGTALLSSGRRPSIINSLLSTLSPFSLRIVLSTPYQYRFELYPDKERSKPLRTREFVLDNTDHECSTKSTSSSSSSSPPSSSSSSSSSLSTNGTEITSTTAPIPTSSSLSLLPFSILSYLTFDNNNEKESEDNPSSTVVSKTMNNNSPKYTLHIHTKYKDNSLQYQCIETYSLLNYHQIRYKVTWSTVDNDDGKINRAVPTPSSQITSTPLVYTGTWKRIETVEEQRAYKYIDEIFRPYSSSLSSLSTETKTVQETINPVSSPSVLLPPPMEVASPPPNVWYIPNFTGSWTVDYAVSDSMDPMLTLMGIPWLVKKIALGMEITTVIEHNISIKEVKTTEKASAGVLNTNDMIADGIMVEKTGKDGKTAKVTCKIYEPSKDDIEKYKALGCMQIITVFPDGGGTSDNVWTLIDEGKKMKQKIIFTRGEKSVIINRILINKEWKPQPPPPVVTLPLVVTSPTVSTNSIPTTDLQISVSSVEASKALLPASPLPLTSPVGSVPSSSVSTSRTLHHLPSWIATEWERDPFFIPLSGKWSVDQARSQSLDPLWKTMGIGSFARFLVKNIEIISRISHSKFLFMSQDSSTLGLHKVVIPLDGQWRPIKQADGRWMLCRGTHTHGSGDKGPTWVGYEGGMIPPILLRAGHVHPSSTQSPLEQRQQRQSSLSAAAVAAAAIAGGESAYFPYYSSLPFDLNKYTTSSVTIETLLMDVTDIVQTLQQSSSSVTEETKSKSARKPITSNRIVSSNGSSAVNQPTDNSDSDSLASRRTSNASDILNTDIAYQINATTVNNKAILTGGTSSPNRKLSPAVTAAINSGMPLWQALPYTNPLPRCARLVVLHKLENRTTLVQQYTHIAGTDNQNHDIVLSKVERSLILAEDDTVITTENIRNDRQRIQHARAIILSRRGEADKLRKQILIADAERAADEAADEVLDQATEREKSNATTQDGNLRNVNNDPSPSTKESKDHTSIASNPWSAIPDNDGTSEEEHVEYDGTNGCQIM